MKECIEPPSPPSSPPPIMGIPAWILFVVVISLITVPAAWFLISSYNGLTEIIKNIENSQATSYPVRLPGIHESDPLLAELHSRGLLEHDTMSNRHERATAFIATRTWLRFMSSIFGGILIFVGAVFILARIETSRDIDFAAQTEQANVALKTSSPGLLLALIGACLMIVPNIASQDITTDDTASFFVGQRHLVKAQQMNAASAERNRITRFGELE